MPFKMTKNQESGILELHLFGRSRDEDYIQARTVFLDKVANSTSKFLIDLYELDNNGSQSTIRLFDFSKKQDVRESILSSKIACVLPKVEESRKDVLFAVNLARHQGYLEMELFFSPQEARVWLS